MRIRPRRWVILTLTAVVLLGLFTGTVLAGEGTNQVYVAGLNPDFLKYINEHPGGSATGYIPPTVDLSFLKGKNIFVRPHQLRTVTLPEKYDLRDYNKLTSVKNQNPYGTCWAHASLASLESCLLPDETNDFSENNMACNHGFVWGPNYGGNNSMAAAYLTRWSGPVEEEDDPYGGLTKREGKLPSKHVQEVFFIPARTSRDNNDNYKEAVMNYGAVSTLMYWDDSYYYETNHSYYFNGSSDTNTNHVINIVGWDDTYPATNFATQPSQNGAFLVRNSWGTYWGDGGYFWVSYDDTVLGRKGDNAVFCNAESVDNYDHIYQYDPLGSTNSLGTGYTTALGANVFTAERNEYLEAVGTYIMGIPGNTAEVWVYTGVDSSPVSGTLQCDQTEAIEAPGYHTIKLNSPIVLKAGEKYSVVIQYNLTDSGNRYPVPIEMYNSTYALSEANPGESYFLNGSWRDTTTLASNLGTTEVNVCIKAYTSDTPPHPVTGVILDKDTMDLTVGGATGTLTAAIQPENASFTNVSWESSKPEIATVNNGVVTPVGIGNTTITVTTEDGGFTDTCEVTVNPVHVTGVTLNKETLSLTVGGIQGTLTAAVQPNNASNPNVSWESSKPEVATVNNGVVTPVGIGNTTITVTTEDGGFTDSCEVTVNPVYVTGVTLDKETMDLIIEGTPDTLTATVHPNNASNTNVSWQSSKPEIAAVNNGLVTPVGIGKTTITVTTEDGGYTDSCEVTVNPIHVTGVTLDKDTMDLIMEGASGTLNPTIAPNNASNTNVSWQSSKPEIATVNNGVVTPVGVGKTIINVTTEDGGFTDSCEVTVNPIHVIGVTLDEETMDLFAGGEAGTLNATIAPNNATNTNVSWQSSKPLVATVSDGVVTPVGVGKTTITVSTEDGGFTDSCEVTVNPIPVTGIALDKETMDLSVGGEPGTLTATIAPNNATNINIGWVSSKPEVATVSDGVVTPVGEGTTTITVITEEGPFTDTCEVTVQFIHVSGVFLDMESLDMAVGGAPETLTATVQPENASNRNVSWESSNPEVATVYNGVVTPIGVGESTITVTAEDGGFTDTCEVTVILNEGPDWAITLDQYPEEAAAGSKISLKATVLSCGTVDAPKATVEIYIDDYCICTKSVSKLKWGKSKTLSIRTTVPADLPMGACSLSAVVTPVLPVQEMLENNNTDAKEISIVLPDLTIDYLEPASGLIAGKAINVMVGISNLRNAEAKKFTVKLYLSEDGETCGELLGTKKISKLGMGSMDLKIRAKAPKYFSLENYYIIAVIDEENVVNEEYEENNRLVWSNTDI